jgi:glutamyl-tRNA synthetase
MEKKVRVRFAPSPTGPLHVGGARTALFNYLYAKQVGGVFVLRFEDTDESRSEAVFEESIVSGLKWLGLNWDEEYYQSKRAEVYQTYLQKLTDAGLTYKQDGGIYFRLPTDSREIIVHDIVRGEVKFNSQDFDDIVLFKRDGTPTFHFANVVDDIDMNITHVIRGEDHLSNTPKHILLYEALGAEIPQFAHIPLILNPDRSKMSKRTGDTAVEEYQKAGYLPEAMINFLVQLGWSPPEDTTPSSVIRQLTDPPLQELIRLFNLERVQKAGAVFDLKYLNHLNHHYLMQKSLDEYVELATPYLNVIPSVAEESKQENKQDGSTDPLTRFVLSSPKGLPANLLTRALALVQDRAQTLSEIPELIEYFFQAPDYDAKLLVFKKSSPDQTQKGLDAALKVLEVVDESEWNQAKLQQILDQVIATEGLQPGDIFWPVRVALSGEEGSPSPVELLEALSKLESISRIKTAIKKLVSSI